MYTITICDDESVILEKIAALTKQFFSDKSDVQICTYSDSLALFQELPASELYLLDVRMPAVSGMELAQKIRTTSPDCSIIFISSLCEPVFESFQYAPLRYIRKEYLESELPEALSAFLSAQRTASDTLDIPVNNHVLSLPITSIRYLESKGHYVNVYTLKKNYRIRGKLSDLIAKQSSPHLAQPNKSFAVNLAFVSVYTNNHIILDNGIDISVTRTYKETFQNDFMKYQRSFHNGSSI